MTKYDLINLDLNLRNTYRGYSDKALFPGEAIRFRNLMLNRNGIVVPRPGMDVLVNMNPYSYYENRMCQGIAYFKNHWVVAIYGDVLCYPDGSFPIDPSTHDCAYYGPTSGPKPVKFIPWGDYLIIINCEDYPLRYDGSEIVDLSGSPPDSVFGENFHDTLYLINNTNRLYYSASSNWQSWPSSNWMDVGSSGSAIRSLCCSGDTLYIFKDESIWRLTGHNENDFYLEKITSNLGVDSYQVHTVQAMAENTMLFMSSNKIWKRCLGGLSYISPQISNVLDPEKNQDVVHYEVRCTNTDSSATLEAINSAMFIRSPNPGNSLDVHYDAFYNDPDLVGILNPNNSAGDSLLNLRVNNDDTITVYFDLGLDGLTISDIQIKITIVDKTQNWTDTYNGSSVTNTETGDYAGQGALYEHVYAVELPDIPIGTESVEIILECLYDSSQISTTVNYCYYAKFKELTIQKTCIQNYKYYDEVRYIKFSNYDFLNYAVSSLAIEPFSEYKMLYNMDTTSLSGYEIYKMFLKFKSSGSLSKRCITNSLYRGVSALEYINTDTTNIGNSTDICIYDDTSISGTAESLFNLVSIETIKTLDRNDYGEIKTWTNSTISDSVGYKYVDIYSENILYDYEYSGDLLTLGLNINSEAILKLKEYQLASESHIGEEYIRPNGDIAEFVEANSSINIDFAQTDPTLIYYVGVVYK